MTWHNENDPKAAAWLRELMKRGLIPEGEVDERSIEDIGPSDCQPTSHFFAGIGGWPYALRLAGWPVDEPVWTGSCPCQPFSAAGALQREADRRHLWPAFRRLIAVCRPPTIFGEQVSGRAGLEWLAGVRADLEALGYAVGAADLCAAGVGAPHIRQRLFWGASNTDRTGLASWNESWQSKTQNGIIEAWRQFKRVHAAGAWAQRETESCLRVFVDGIPGRVGLLRGYGNAIVPQVAAAFVSAFMEARR